jgi:hypothetical protein
MIRLRNGNAARCSHCAPNIINLIGQQFSRLTVIARGENTARGLARWICECVCGTRTLVRGADLRNGRSKSCGCLAKEVAAGIERSKATATESDEAMTADSKKDGIPVFLQTQNTDKPARPPRAAEEK